MYGFTTIRALTYIVCEYFCIYTCEHVLLKMYKVKTCLFDFVVLFVSCNIDLCVSFSVDGRPVHGSKEWFHKPVLVMYELVLVLAFKTH